MIKKKTSLETKLIIFGTILITTGFISNFYFSNLESDIQLENLKENNDIPKCGYYQQVNSQDFNSHLNDLLSLSKGKDDPFKPLINDTKVNGSNPDMLPEQGNIPEFNSMSSMSLTGLNKLQYMFKQDQGSNDLLLRDTIMDIIELQGIIGEGKNRQAIISSDGKCDFYKVGSVVNGNKIIEIADNFIKLKTPLGIIRKVEISYKKSNNIEKKGDKKKEDNLTKSNVNYIFRQLDQDVSKQESDNNF